MVFIASRTSGKLALEPGRKESQQFHNVVPDIFGLEPSELASLGAKRFHGKPPLIGLGVPRRSGGGRVQTFAIIRFLFGRALTHSRLPPPIRRVSLFENLSRRLRHLLGAAALSIFGRDV